MIGSRELATVYMDLKEVVIGAGYAHEIDWQEDVDFERVSEREFLMEAAWVVLSSGFREKTVRAKFAGVSEAFLDWGSAERIAACREHCERRALGVFGHRAKVRAIGDIVSMVAEEGYNNIRDHVRRDGVEYLRIMPYMGPVTAHHLAKNVGISVAKPDRHLVRMACMAGRGGPMAMCEEVANVVGDAVEVVDLVFWRYATLDAEYEVVFAERGVRARKRRPCGTFQSR